MTPEQLADRLADTPAERLGPSPSCPDEHVVAGYVDGRLDARESVQLERHLADCGHCLELVALLVGERDTGHATTPMPAATPAGPAAASARPGRWGNVHKWAVAAALVLAVPVMFQMGRNVDRGVEGQGSPPFTATRMAVPAARALEVLSPDPGSAVDPSRLAFSWTEIPGTPYYDLRIVTDEGDVVVEQRVKTASWKPPASLDLKQGAEYFFLVEAYPSGDKALSSRHVPFRVPEAGRRGQE